MAKVTDLTAVQQMADSIVDEKCPDLVSTIGRDNAVWCLVAIYTTNDVCKGYGQDFHLDTGARRGTTGNHMQDLTSFSGEFHPFFGLLFTGPHGKSRNLRHGGQCLPAEPHGHDT